MRIQGLIKAVVKAIQTPGGRVLTPVVAGVVCGVSLWAVNAMASPVAAKNCKYTVIYAPDYGSFRYSTRCESGCSPTGGCPIVILRADMDPGNGGTHFSYYSQGMCVDSSDCVPGHT